MEYFPLFLRLKDQSVLVVGAGTVAARKVALLLAAEAEITVVAPAVGTEIAELAGRGKLTFVQAEFASSQVQGQRLVVAATNDEAINEAISQAAHQASVLVNVVDDLTRSNCIVPAIIDRDPVLVACSTGGSSPVLATELRAQLEAVLPTRLGDLARFARRHRAGVKAQLPDLAARRRFWLTAMRGEIAAAILAGRSTQAEELLAHQLAATSAAPTDGQCVLVMLNSDDPDHLKLGALRALFAADLLLHEQVTATPLLNLARRDAPRQALSAAISVEDYVQSRLLALAPTLRAAGTVVYLSPHEALWGEALASALRAEGFLTQVW
jgi:uroporphyrin-III C-methyltransferase / precorrin-2 dehydrogenase / sirohydrochlorin ferrochelatase